MIIRADIPYRPKWGRLLLAFASFGGLACLLYFTAITNDRALILDGIIRLGVHEASRFYGVLAAICAGFLLLVSIPMISFPFCSGVLRFTETALQIPQGLFMTTRQVPYDAISQVRIRRVRHIRFLEIHYGSRKVTANLDWLPDAAFEEICSLLSKRATPGRVGKDLSEPPSSRKLSFGKRLG